jgi:hypothetical protein
MPRQAHRLVRQLGFPVTNTLMGLGGYPGHRPAVRRHARHARHLRGQHGHAALRRAAGGGRPLRRPRDRQPGAFRRGAAQDHPHRHRSLVDLQARQGRCAHRRPRAGGARRNRQADRIRRRAAGRGGAQGLVEADRRVARQGLPQVRPQEQDHQAAVRDREALRSHQGRRLRHLRRRPAPDVGGAVLQVRQAAPLDQLRRPRHHGLRPAGGDGRATGASRLAGGLRDRRGQRSRCASRSCRPASSTACRSRSSLNNRYLGMVRQWQQLFHGNRYAESYMDALPDFVKLAEAYGHVGMRIEKPADVEGALRRPSSARTTWSSWTSPSTRPRTSTRWCRAARASPK